MPPSPRPSPWLLLQLADAAFPSGGFAHSTGIEAAVTIGAQTSPEELLDAALWQAGHALLPFVRASAEAPARLAELDLRCDATIASHVANRASRALGRSLASAAAHAFADDARVRRVTDHATRGPAHQAPVFGALFGALGMSPSDAEVAFLHGTARQILSSSVRLGLLGPLEAQAIQAARAPLMDRVLQTACSLSIDDVATVAPLLEIWGAKHDELDARMFQS